MRFHNFELYSIISEQDAVLCLSGEALPAIQKSMFERAAPYFDEAYCPRTLLGG